MVFLDYTGLSKLLNWHTLQIIAVLQTNNCGPEALGFENLHLYIIRTFRIHKA